MAKIIGSNIIDFEEVDSTNRYAARMIQHTSFHNGTIIRADHQTAGIGQGENKWFTEPFQNLTLSIILHPHFLPAERQFMLNKAMTLGVCDLVNNYVPGCFIKWPNDLYIKGGKIGGMLIQHTVCGNRLEISIVGIGLNVNQVSFPEGIRNPASLKLILGYDLPLAGVFSGLCETLDYRYKQLMHGDDAALDKSYCENMLWFDEKRTFFNPDGAGFEGRIKGVDESGRLIILDMNGASGYFNHGEVEYRL
jgi:BirA family transcriptional regulator, biotin operon repressor / biotin---[acetyl-CoA-carboxylase] ligase